MRFKPEWREYSCFYLETMVVVKAPFDIKVFLNYSENTLVV
jgi:hypothetical protein